MLSKETITILDDYLAETYNELNIPGMALVISQHGETIYENYRGYRDVELQLPVTADTVFGVASITKSLTALAIMQLRDAGKLDIEDSVMKWLPDLKWPREDYLSQLKIHHLMSHTSGLPGLSLMNNARSTSILEDPDGEYLFGTIPRYDDDVIQTVDDLIRKIGEAEFTLLGRPSDAFNYSNEGYGILQAIIERASGMSFIQYVEEHIFVPIGMTDAYFLTSDIKDQDNVTELYAYKMNQKEVFHSPAWWDTGDIYTNGSLKTSPADLMKYLEIYRLHGIVNGKRILSEKSIEDMTTPVFSLPNGGCYGYGLEEGNLNDIKHFGHGGSIKGVSANFQAIKEKDLTACLLINIADVPAEEILRSNIAKILNLSEVTGTEKDISPLTKENLHRFSGCYQSAEGYELTFTINNTGLVLEMDNRTIPIYPISKYDFITSKGDNYHFTTSDGQVTGVYLGKRMIPKVK